MKVLLAVPLGLLWLCLLAPRSAGVRVDSVEDIVDSLGEAVDSIEEVLDETLSATTEKLNSNSLPDVVPRSSVTRSERGAISVVDRAHEIVDNLLKPKRDDDEETDAIEADATEDGDVDTEGSASEGESDEEIEDDSEEPSAVGDGLLDDLDILSDLIDDGSLSLPSRRLRGPISRTLLPSLILPSIPTITRSVDTSSSAGTQIATNFIDIASPLKAGATSSIADGITEGISSLSDNLNSFNGNLSPALNADNLLAPISNLGNLGADGLSENLRNAASRASEAASNAVESTTNLLNSNLNEFGTIFDSNANSVGGLLTNKADEVTDILTDNNNDVTDMINDNNNVISEIAEGLSGSLNSSLDETLSTVRESTAQAIDDTNASMLVNRVSLGNPSNLLGTKNNVVESIRSSLLNVQETVGSVSRDFVEAKEGFVSSAADIKTEASNVIANDIADVTNVQDTSEALLTTVLQSGDESLDTVDNPVTESLENVSSIVPAVTSSLTTKVAAALQSPSRRLQNGDETDLLDQMRNRLEDAVDETHERIEAHFADGGTDEGDAEDEDNGEDGGDDKDDEGNGDESSETPSRLLKKKKNKRGKDSSHKKTTITKLLPLTKKGLYAPPPPPPKKSDVFLQDLDIKRHDNKHGRHAKYDGGYKYEDAKHGEHIKYVPVDGYY